MFLEIMTSIGWEWIEQTRVQVPDSLEEIIARNKWRAAGV